MLPGQPLQGGCCFYRTLFSKVLERQVSEWEGNQECGALLGRLAWSEGLGASHSPDKAEQLQVAGSHRIYLGPRQEAIMEKVSSVSQDAVQSIEVTEAFEHLPNRWLVFQFLQSFCKALHTDIVAVCLKDTKIHQLPISDSRSHLGSWARLLG